MRWTIILFLSIFSWHTSNAELQKITVKGVVICNRKRLANIKIELLERDEFDPDDELAKIETNREGEFELSGEHDEIGKIEPFLRIYHNCNVKPGCTRISEYKMPRESIGSIYDMTYVTLDIIAHNEQMNC